jgi:tetratricopeptide (TPR) repeat protein
MAHVALSNAYAGKGMYTEALKERQIAAHLSPDDTINLAGFGRIYAAMGNRAEALKILDALFARSNKQYVALIAFALIYTALGDKDNAFVWLEKSYEERSIALTGLRSNTLFDVLRPDPRFRILEQKMGLPL